MHSLEQLRSLSDPDVLLAGLFQTVPVSLQLFDPQGYSVLVNPAFLKLPGRTPPPEYSLLQDEILERQGMLPIVRKAFEDGEVVVAPPAWYDLRELKGFDHTGVIGQRIGIQGTLMPLLRAARRPRRELRALQKPNVPDVLARRLREVLAAAPGSAAAEV